MMDGTEMNPEYLRTRLPIADCRLPLDLASEV
jgi:hypothetical protein